MIAKEFEEVLTELRAVEEEYRCDYRICLYRNGAEIACIYGDGNLDNIYFEERYNGTVLVYTDEIGITIDDAKVWSI